MKHRLGYSSIIGLQIILGLTFQILFARKFGVSTQADIYFAGHAILTFLVPVVAWMTEQFMQHYHEMKERDVRAAHELYWAAFTYTAVAGSVLATVAYLTIPIVSGIIAPGFDSGQQAELATFSSLLMTSLALGPLVGLNNALMNAEMHFLGPYLIALLVPALNLATLIFIEPSAGYIALAVAPVAGAGLGLAAQQVFLWKALGIVPRIVFRHPAAGAMMQGGLKMRIGHQLYALREPITNSVLSGFGAGVISQFAYANRILSLAQMVITTPVLQVFAARCSQLLARGTAGFIQALLRRAVLEVVAVFVPIVLLLGIELPTLLHWVIGDSFSAADRSGIHLLYLWLIPFFAVAVVEAPFTAVVISARNASLVITANAVFCGVYFGLMYMITRADGVLHAIPIALFVAQVSNFIFYYRGAAGTIGGHSWASR